MNKSIEIKNNFLISIGENYLVITLGQDEDNLLKENIQNKTRQENNKDIINIKIFSNNIKNYILTFDKNKKNILIGRSSNCDVIIEDNLLSRFHCMIYFKDNKWFICDGYMENDKNKKSTNGTWLYAFEDINIEQGTIFKSNHYLFICSFE